MKVTYPKASLSLSYAPARASKAQRYSNYVGAALSVGAVLHRCPTAFCELAHVIEKVERELAWGRNSHQRNKEFRHDCPQHRLQVLKEVGASWTQVRRLAAGAELRLDDPMSETFRRMLASMEVDSYDCCLVQAAHDLGVRDVITDDADLATAEGLRVFTLHGEVIARANAAGRLQVR